jgi:hypothetical protein
MGNKFPPPSSLKQLEIVLEEEWYELPLEIVQNVHESIPGRIAAVLKARMAQHHSHKETVQYL